MDVLGFHLSSSEPVFLAFLAVHVTAALTAIVTGASAALIKHKGRGRHSRLGRRYLAALCIVFVTAIGMATMRWSETFHLLLIGTLAFGSALTGFLARRLRWQGDTIHILGMGVSFVAMLTAFYVDSGHQLPLWDRLPTLAYWLIPGAVGTPVIWRAIHRANKASSFSRQRTLSP